MGSEEYWWMFHLIRGDVESALASHITFLTINNLGATDPEIAYKYNRAAEFWNLYQHALQTTFFISFGRIFDRRKDSFSMQDLVDVTIEYPGFFSKDALLERRLRDSATPGMEPEWLADYVAKAWVPTRKDLESLGAALTPHAEKFNRIYEPIRHKYFAHRGKESDEAIATLFGKTLIADVTEILKFLDTLLRSIQDMAHNGSPPDLKHFGPYEQYVHNLNRKVETFIRSLPCQ